MYILYPQSNGQLAVIFPCRDVNDSNKDVPQGSEYKIVEYLDIDHNFFNAYEFDKNIGAKINIIKAKEIQLDKFRATRTILLEKLDIDFMRAVEADNTTSQQEIASKKQALRDVTKTELPDDLLGIKSTWPNILS